MPGVAGVSAALSGVLERPATQSGGAVSGVRPAGSAGESANLREKSNTPATGSSTKAADPNNPKNLTDAEKAQVRELQARDSEVHRHERAHAAVGGPYAGLPSYSYTRGPDGRSYATDGEVEIDTSPAQTPEGTIQKMEVVIRAALAPAQPSAQDHAVANKARKLKTEAIAEKHQQELDGGDSAAGSASTSGEPSAAPRADSDAESATALYRQVAQIAAGALGGSSAGKALQLVA